MGVKLVEVEFLLAELHRRYGAVCARVATSLSVSQHRGADRAAGASTRTQASRASDADVDRAGRSGQSPMRARAPRHFSVASARSRCQLPRPPHAASGRNGMVAAEHELASQAGVRILQQGGNAVDAAVATSLAVGVVNPTSCGIGGGGFMLIFEHATGAVYALDYRETAPAAAQARHVRARRQGGAGAQPAQRAGGGGAGRDRRPVRRVAPLRDAARSPRWRRRPSPTRATGLRSSRIWPTASHASSTDPRAGQRWRPSSSIPTARRCSAGETLRQPALADTLERIARGGPAAFYDGPVAAAIVDSVHAAGGVMSLGRSRRLSTNLAAAADAPSSTATTCTACRRRAPAAAW